jgi:hypothetical protein
VQPTADQLLRLLLSLQMAYQGANPGPFVPPNMHCVHVENHIPMVQLVAGHRPPPQNENLAIATMTPLLGNVLDFPAIHQILLEFLVDQRRIAISGIQPTHLGQAFVKFVYPLVRDSLIAEGSIAFDDCT